MKSFPKRNPVLSINFALAESDSTKSISDNAEGDRVLSLLQEIAESFELPSDYLANLPNDLRLDLNDAAFDLSNGPVLDECGQELGEILLNLSRAWEKADTSSSNAIVQQLPSLLNSLKGKEKSAFGKRLIKAGRRFSSMGLYGEGELQKIAKAMIEAGEVLSSGAVNETDEKPDVETRMFKFGSLQVQLTPSKANIGAAIALVFGFLSWELAQGIQSIPESSLEYANDNALLLAKSLRGALLVAGYTSTVLSTSTSIGLFLLGRELGSKSK